MKLLLGRVVVGWVLLIGLFSWLPLVRSVFDGDSYLWGTTFFDIPLKGAGLGGDLWYLILKTAVALFVLYALVRRWRPVGAVLAAVWTAILFADNLRGYIVDPDAMVFHGDTLGVQLNLTLIAPIMSGVMLIACLLLWRLLPDRSVDRSVDPSVDHAARRPYPLQPLNLKRVGLLAGLLPIQFVLLFFGTPHGLTDQIGVVLTILQWFLMGWALAMPVREDIRPTPGRLVGDRP